MKLSGYSVSVYLGLSVGGMVATVFLRARGLAECSGELEVELVAERS